MQIALTFHILILLAVIPLIVRQKRIPASAAAWIAIVALIPALGILLYILAGYRPLQHTPEVFASPERGISGLITRNCGSRPARHNRVKLLHNGNNAFSALIASLQRASRSIHMEYYIFRDDRIGRAITEILIRKARAGVEVRVIYDAIGSWQLRHAMLRRMRKAGIDIRPYEPLRFPWFTPRAQRRNHRKIVVTDGAVAYLGGINIAKYYLDGDNMGRWRDEHLRLEGDIVADLQRLFLADWRRAGGTLPDGRSYIARHDIREPLAMQLAWAEEGPTRLTLAEAFAAAIVRARNCVRISSPYFIPPTLLLDALRLAAHSGVRVVVMIPTCSDSRPTDLISESYIDDLLAAGVELHRYKNGFLHAKMLVVDDTVASVGTANMDYRSLLDNLEVTAFTYDRTLIHELADTFDTDLNSCRQVTSEEWARRSAWRRTLADLLRLLAPVM